ncbi:unnamed protein product, partial [marine sediment metagenome]
AVFAQSEFMHGGIGSIIGHLLYNGKSWPAFDI